MFSLEEYGSNYVQEGKLSQMQQKASSLSPLSKKKNGSRPQVLYILHVPDPSNEAESIIFL